MSNTKIIRISKDTYEELLSYKAALEIENRQRLSFSDAIEMLFGEVAGLEYELGSVRLRQEKTNSQSDSPLSQ